MNEESWVAAVKGCKYVLHMASPFPNEEPASEDEVIKPAVNGTLSVLRACDEGVKRVVLTSSNTAVNCGYLAGPRPWTEADWTDVEQSPRVYFKSKTLAEKAAWDYMKELPEEQKFELAVVNPSFVMGPVLCGTPGTSAKFLQRFLNHEMPALPKVHFGIVDIRDVALAHVNAMIIPEAAGNRHIITTKTLSFKDIATILDSEFRPQGYNVPTMEMPTLLVKFVGLFDKKLQALVPMLDHQAEYDTSRMQTVLGITPRDMKHTILDQAYSMIERGIVEKTDKYTGPIFSEEQ